MKTISRFFLIISLALFFNACTHNNGDIGELFGTWKLQSITINNSLDTNYQNNILWKFQSSIISMIKTNDATHDRFESWGTWEYANDGSQIIFDFTHFDNDNPVGADKYSPLSETHLPKATKIRLDIKKLNGNEMILSYIDDSNGDSYIYKLKKWL